MNPANYNNSLAKYAHWCKNGANVKGIKKYFLLDLGLAHQTESHIYHLERC